MVSRLTPKFLLDISEWFPHLALAPDSAGTLVAVTTCQPLFRRFLRIKIRTRY